MAGKTKNVVNGWKKFVSLFPVGYFVLVGYMVA